jgi:anti-anti-sigma factor
LPKTLRYHRSALRTLSSRGSGGSFSGETGGIEPVSNGTPYTFKFLCAEVPRSVSNQDGPAKLPQGEQPEYPVRLELREVRGGGRLTIELEGEVDLASAGILADALTAIDASALDTVVVDLRELTFIDSTGLRAIIAGKNHCAEQGTDFLLVPGPPQVQRLFAVVGLLEVLSFSEG